MRQIIFDSSAIEFILDAFGKSVDSEGFLVEKDKPTQRVLTSEGEPVLASELGSIRKGSEVYGKSDIISVIKLSDSLSE